MEDILREYVDDIPNTYAYPYMARITGEDPVYNFQRSFLRYEDRSPTIGGHWYTYRLPCEGVYERCTRRFDRYSHKLLGRERDWFAFFDGEYYELDQADVLYALQSINAQMQLLPGGYKEASV